MSDITRSEAIDVIELIMRKYEEDECMCCDIMLGDEDYEALRLARDSLKADEAYQLEYEKPEICEDCIDRKSVLNGINEAMNYIDWGQSQDGDAFRHLCASLYRTVTDMPRVLPKADNSVLEDINKMLAEINGEIACAEYHEVECNHKTEKQDGRRVIAKIVHKYCDKYMESE